MKKKAIFHNLSKSGLQNLCYLYLKWPQESFALLEKQLMLCYFLSDCICHIGVSGVVKKPKWAEQSWQHYPFSVSMHIQCGCCLREIKWEKEHFFLKRRALYTTVNILKVDVRTNHPAQISAFGHLRESWSQRKTEQPARRIDSQPADGEMGN